MIAPFRGTGPTRIIVGSITEGHIRGFVLREGRYPVSIRADSQQSSDLIPGRPFRPLPAELPGCPYPRTSRKRLPPNQGTAASVLSNPAATSNGLWARF
jgi:hypothetical protein